jgi:hypothetical protein
MDYINIPVELCKYALMEHNVNQLRLYVFLKSKCSGHIKLSKERILSYCKELGYKTPKTFKTNLNWLMQNKWITVNTKSGNYRIKGFVEIANKLNFVCIKGAIFEPLEFKNFKPFIIAAVITYYMILKNRYNKERSESLKGGSRLNRFKKPVFFSLPHTYLAKVLNCSKSTAEYYRSIAVKSMYIIPKSTFEKLDIPAKEVRLYKKYNDLICNIKLLKGKPHLQKNDKLFSSVILRTKKELKKNLKHNGKLLYR